MSSFTTPLRVEVLKEGSGGRVNAAVLTPFEFYSDLIDGDVVVPVDFVTDFASIPRPLWIIAAPLGRHAKAAVVHDFTYLTQPCSRKVSDDMFYEGMRVLGVGKTLAFCIWASVRLFGWKTWKGYAK